MITEEVYTAIERLTVQELLNLEPTLAELMVALSALTSQFQPLVCHTALALLFGSLVAEIDSALVPGLDISIDIEQRLRLHNIIARISHRETYAHAVREDPSTKH